MAIIYLTAAFLLLLSIALLCYRRRVLTSLESWVATCKVNLNLDKSFSNYIVAPDSDYQNTIKTVSKFDHSLWNGLMQRYVSAGIVEGVTTNVVDYRRIANDKDADSYRRLLASADLEQLKQSPNELLALYINAYNCLCIGHVTRYLNENGRLPVSVTETTPVEQKGAEIWDVVAGVVGGETVSLNDIEHKILRSRWAEPRVHASIVCASASCPNLRQEAFVATKINEQMDDQTKTWVGDATKGVMVKDGTQTFSRIFLWFKGDFDSSGGPVAWVSQYLEEKSAKLLSSEKDMEYFKYNWSLNNLDKK